MKIKLIFVMLIGIIICLMGYIALKDRSYNIDMPVPNQIDSNTLKETHSSNYVGVIDRDMKIHVHLTFNGERVLGYYYYDIFEKILILKGSENKAGFVKLIEFDEYDNPTGVFEGKFSNDKKMIEGNWTDMNSSKVFPFTLTALDDNQKMVEYLYDNKE